MGKLFFDVFPDLKIPSEMERMMADVEVTKVSTNRNRDYLRVYLLSSRLIEKKRIFGLEKDIKKQLFPYQELTVKIIEKFSLSEQYNPKRLLQIYRDSLLEELRAYSHLEYSILKMARIHFPQENVMQLLLEDSVITRQKSEELVQILEKIICERCGMDVNIQVEYIEPTEKRYKQDSNIRIQNEVQAIISQSSLGNNVLEAEELTISGNVEEVETKQPQTKNTKSEPVGSAASAEMEKKTVTKGGVNNSRGKREGYHGFKRSDNPEVIYGRDFEEEPIAIEQIAGEMGEVVIRGKILNLETREIRNEKTIIMFSISDFTDTIMVKMFAKNEFVSDITAEVKKGAFLKIKGVTTIDRFDGELTIGSIAGMKKIADFTSSRIDTIPRKRVELHCHTKMSDMDGVSEVKDIIKRAQKWGHPALAVTDHGDVQAFPDANHAISPGDDFKVIYGVEAYLVDDLKTIVENSRGQSLSETYVVFDLETTGFSPLNNKIIEIGAVKVVEGKITERFSTFVNPEAPIPFKVEELTHIRDDMVLSAPKIEEILPDFMEFCEGAVMVAHNAEFDMSFISKNCERQGLSCEYTVVDTVALARVLLPQLNRFKLNNVAKVLKVSLENHHRAVDDAACTAEIFVKFIHMMKERGIEDLDQVNDMGNDSVDNIRKLHSHHAIILATNDTGRINLYRLVSDAHLTYFYRQPRIPKSEFLKHREGLLIGSACEAGELYQAIDRKSVV